ncbi:helix-turn-helix domain-containing protein [Butyrivibrio sp. FC2001]|uniref:helix-turn-helix domain-containing protein n=1 Tax=Butyrivibrio sp. FC2001 TaxID=1280671 RepID=UPI00047BBF17|nr:helix-turn-helix domain-containing protein [Butyrivibrio sp. FC2001]
MTDEEKMRIRTLRQQGVGYQAIANMLNMNRDTVRAYCKRHGLNGIQVSVKMNTRERIKNGEACGFCAGPIQKRATGRPARFCSEVCRRNYWKLHREESQHSEKATYIMECAYCHTVFKSYGNKKRKYCCHEHYVLDRYGDLIGGEVSANSETNDTEN